MAKQEMPRLPLPPRPRRADLAQPLADPSVGRVATTFAGLDVEPLLVALRIGALDSHLEEIAALVNDRLAAIDALEELIAASHLHVGDRVRLGNNLRPQYLHGRMVTIIAKDGEKWLVRLDEPVGRFTNADLRVYARQLEPARLRE